MVTALFATGIFGTDTFGAPSGASFAYLSTSGGFDESGFAALAFSGNVINPNVIATLAIAGTILGRSGTWDNGTFDNNVFVDTESSFGSLFLSGAFHQETFAVLKTSAGEIRIPGTVETFRAAIATSASVVGTAFRISTLPITAQFAETPTDRTKRGESTLFRSGLRARGKFRSYRLINQGW